MKMHNIVKLLIAIGICQFIGNSSFIFTTSAIPTWYATLQKPWFNPPNWLFGPAWVILYTLMGISLYLIWDKGLKHHGIKKSIYIFDLQIFLAQLALNALWTFLFFGLKSPMYALIEIIFLWIAIAVTIIRFYKISKTAARILVPYLLWVTFASFLNYYVWILNA